jgi:hypothetical protein
VGHANKNVGIVRGWFRQSNTLSRGGGKELLEKLEKYKSGMLSDTAPWMGWVDTTKIDTIFLL